MNLPNALTISRIVATPFVAALPFIPSPSLRFAGFVLFLAAAITDYYDGALARRYGTITDLGRLLDPLADKLLLVGTFVPMFLLQHPPGDLLAIALPYVHDEASAFAFRSVLGTVHFPWWILAIILGRELFMTVFRQIAQRRGTVISAIGPAKWKAGVQFTWIGAAYAWIAARTLADRRAWDGNMLWAAVEQFLGVVGTVTMYAAVVLTVWSLLVYLRRYGWLLVGNSPAR